MIQNQRLSVFLDTCALIAGIASAHGAAREVLRIAEAEIIEIVISQQVIVEADRTIMAELSDLTDVYRDYMKYLSPTLVDDPAKKEIKKYASLINPEDAPILATAGSSGAAYLVTWDKKHFIKSKAKGNIKIKIVTPGEFLKDFRDYIETLC